MGVIERTGGIGACRAHLVDRGEGRRGGAVEATGTGTVGRGSGRRGRGRGGGGADTQGARGAGGDSGRQGGGQKVLLGSHSQGPGSIKGRKVGIERWVGQKSTEPAWCGSCLPRPPVAALAPPPRLACVPPPARLDTLAVAAGP